VARIRSPNYPAIGLTAAVERARAIHKAERHNRMDRDTVVRLMGFGGYNGASAGVLSAVIKYGLLELVADGEYKITDLAARILVPHDENEKAAAIVEAATKPPLFVELNERWPDDPPSDPSLTSYLLRRGFADSAIEGVMRSYRETLGLVRESAPQYDSVPEDGEGSVEMDVQAEDRGGERRIQPPALAPALAPVSHGPGLNLIRTETGYIVQLSGAVLTKGHVDEVVTLLTALKASMPDATPDAIQSTEH
jgi:hypothetical protein